MNNLILNHDATVSTKNPGVIYHNFYITLMLNENAEEPLKVGLAPDFKNTTGHDQLIKYFEVNQVDPLVVIPYEEEFKDKDTNKIIVAKKFKVVLDFGVIQIDVELKPVDNTAKNLLLHLLK